MTLTIGERVSWRGLNREYTGEIEGFYGPFAIATIEGTDRKVLIHDGTELTKNNKTERNGT